MIAPEAIQDCLVNLQKAWPDHQLATDALAKRNGIYIEKLQDLDIRDLRQACDKAAKTLDRFPTIAWIRKEAEATSKDREARAALEVADRDKPENLVARAKRVTGKDAVWLRERHEILANVFDSHCRGILTDPQLAQALGCEFTGIAGVGIVSPDSLRDEFLMLVERVGWHPKDQCGDRQAFKSFVADGARMWERIRPVDYGSEAETRRGDYGFVLEAWARWHLRAEPLHVDYWNARRERLYLAMTGQRPELAGDADFAKLWPVPGLSEQDQEILATWRRSDARAAKIRDGIDGPYWGADGLAKIYVGLCDRRWSENLRLAQVHYGCEVRPAGWGKPGGGAAKALDDDPRPLKPAFRRATDAEVRASAQRLNKLP